MGSAGRSGAYSTVSLQPPPSRRATIPQGESLISRNFATSSMPKTLCDQPFCQYPFVGSTGEAHRKEYHSTAHSFRYQGIKVKVFRRLDGKLPCPCRSELHARYSFKKLTALTRLPQHPLPEESPHADHDIAGRDPLPDSSFSNSGPSVHGPLAPTSSFDPSTLSTRPTSPALDAEKSEMAEPDAHEVRKEWWVEKVAESEYEGGSEQISDGIPCQSGTNE
ncbi:hypothetical protein F5876DRAFT_66404, partial [Lentinula aff. lateritia]